MNILAYTTLSTKYKIRYKGITTMNNETITLLYYVQNVKDKKHNIEFKKDKVSYRGHTFDAVLSKEFRKHLEKVMQENNFEYPLLLELSANTTKKQYFTKPKKYDFVNKETGVVEKRTKTAVTILSCNSISQGEFINKSLDDIVNDIESMDDIEEE